MKRPDHQPRDKTRSAQAKRQTIERRATRRLLGKDASR